jgi:hypothetical protein
MKFKERYLKAKYEDKIVFKGDRERAPQSEAKEVWRRSQGIWKDHTVFGNMSTKEVIEWLRGEDCDV